MSKSQTILPSEKWLKSAISLYGKGTLYVPVWPGYDGFAEVTYVGLNGSVQGTIIGDPQFLDRYIGTSFAGGHAEVIETAQKIGISISTRREIQHV